MEYLITDIKDITSKKRLVYINYEPAFPLYAGEVKSYHLAVNRIIADSVYDEIMNLLYTRAFTRIAYLIKDRDYTEYEISSKLRTSHYPEDVILAAVERAKKEKFIDDYRYADNFVHFKAESRSRNMVANKLHAKGVPADIIDSVCDEYYEEHEDAEETIVRDLLAKKLRGVDASSLDYEERQKLFASICRKGFSYDCVKKTFNEII